MVGSLMSGDGDWAGGIVGLERNYEVVEELITECEYLMEVLKTMPARWYTWERINSDSKTGANLAWI